jgi:hypothetical protein
MGSMVIEDFSDDNMVIEDFSDVGSDVGTIAILS